MNCTLNVGLLYITLVCTTSTLFVLGLKWLHYTNTFTSTEQHIEVHSHVFGFIQILEVHIILFTPAVKSQNSSRFVHHRYISTFTFPDDLSPVLHKNTPLIPVESCLMGYMLLLLASLNQHNLVCPPTNDSSQYLEKNKCQVIRIIVRIFLLHSFLSTLCSLHTQGLC